MTFISHIISKNRIQEKLSSHVFIKCAGGKFDYEPPEMLSYYITRKTPTEMAEIRLTNKLMTNK